MHTKLNEHALLNLYRLTKTQGKNYEIKQITLITQRKTWNFRETPQNSSTKFENSYQKFMVSVNSIGRVADNRSSNAKRTNKLFTKKLIGIVPMVPELYNPFRAYDSAL